MRSITLICLVIIFGNPVLAGELYRWVDDQGRLHYSDRPVEGAQAVTLNKPSAPARVPARAATPRPAPPQPAAAAEPTAVVYQSVDIVNPAQDQVLWNIGGALTVRLDVQPGLQPGHRIIVRYDGQPVEGWPPGATSHQLAEVYRGTHTVAAAVTDANGNVLKSAETVTFFVKQTSVLN